MSSELLYALTPVIARRNPNISRSTQEARPELRLEPVLVRPRDDAAHRSELEYAMTELPSPVTRNVDHVVSSHNTGSLHQLSTPTSSFTYPFPDPNATLLNAHEYPNTTYVQYPTYGYTTLPNAPTQFAPSPYAPHPTQTVQFQPRPAVSPAPHFDWERARQQWEQEQQTQHTHRQADTAVRSSVETRQVSITEQPMYSAAIPSTSLTDRPADESERPATIQDSSARTDVSALKASLTRFISYQVPEAELVPDDDGLTFATNEESDTASDDETSPQERPKRRNGMDKRILTIKHAMRVHMLRAMNVTDSKSLPESHIEGQQLPAGSPARFVWESTILKSSHNRRMRKRIIDDFQNRRSMYPDVPPNDFDDRKGLEAVFEQAFTTFRTKWRSQRNHEIALHEKRRDHSKAARSRRFVRKKAKLATRVEARKAISMFGHTTFDNALTIDCMSSEESASDQEGEAMTSNMPAIRSNKNAVLTTRPPPWRSTHLERFYAALDDAAALSPSSTIRRPRGMGRKQRVRGPPREPKSGLGICLPPKGVAEWMIDDSWRDEAKRVHPTLEETLKNLVAERSDEEPFNWAEFEVLGVHAAEV